MTKQTKKTETEGTVRDDQTLPIETVNWREGVGKTLARIDKRTAIMEKQQAQFVTITQVDKKIREANAEQLDEHIKICGLQRQNDRLQREQGHSRTSKKTPISIYPPPTKRAGADLFKNLTLPQIVKYAVFIGFLIGSFVAGARVGG